MARLTLARAIKLNVIDLRGIGMATYVRAQLYGAWISDERKLSGDPKALFLVVECGDDSVLADELRALGLPWIVLQHGWWSYAVSPDRRAQKSFSLAAFRFEPVRYRKNCRVAKVLNLHGYNRSYGDREPLYRVHVTAGANGTVYLPSYKSSFQAYAPRDAAIDFTVQYNAETGEIGIDPDVEMQAVPSEHDYAEACVFVADALRRATLHPKGEGRSP